MPVSLTYSSSTIWLQNPQVANVYAIKKNQALGRTSGGAVYTYDKGSDQKRMELEFANLRHGEKDALETFYKTTVNGIMTTWTYTDHGGTAWNARFLDDELQFIEEASDILSAASMPFYVATLTYPGNRFTKGIWKVKINLEVG